MDTPKQLVTSNMVNGFDPQKSSDLDGNLESLIKRRQESLGPAYRLMYSRPVQLVRAKGCLMWDRDGHEYLDAYNNVPSVGHCHPAVVEAVHRQMQTLCTHTRYIQDEILEFAEQLVPTYGKPIEHVMFTCTGSEANDLAIRIAMHHTGKQGVIISSDAYTGNSYLTSKLSPSLTKTEQVEDWIERIDPPDTFRMTHEQIEAKLIGQLKAAIERLQIKGHGLAVFIADSILSSDGIYPNPIGILKDIADVVHAAGGMVIADEVQTGFGRTGEKLWGFQRHGQSPDFVTMGKPMGNGYPVAAVAMSTEVVRRFGTESRYFNTFGGNNVAIAAAKATFGVLRDEGLQQNAARVGDLLVRELQAIAKTDGRMDVRGAGLYVGVELVENLATKVPDATRALSIIGGLRERRVLISGCGSRGNVLKIRPPLVFSEANVDHFITTFKSVIETV